MRQNSNQRRGRSRNNQNRRPGRNQSFDSNGPGVRLRGTAAQLNEKYQALARDATSAGDRVMAENYHQHADHYYRVMISLNPPQTREEDRQPDLADGEDAQPLDGRGRGERGQHQGGQNQGDQNQSAQNQGAQGQDRRNQDRRDNRNRRDRDRQDRDRQEDGDAPPAAQAGDAAGAETEPRERGRRQPGRRQDFDPRRRSGGRADEAVPGDEPLDQGLHRILGGGPEKARADGDAAEPTGNETPEAGASGDETAGAEASGAAGVAGAEAAGAVEEKTADAEPPEATETKAAETKAAEPAETGEAAPKRRLRRRKPAAEAEETAAVEPVADATV